MPKVFYKEINYKYLFLINIKKKFLSFFIGLISFIGLFYYLLTLSNNLKFSFILNKNKSKIFANKTINKKKHYVVQSKDELWKISDKFFGIVDYFYKIVKENNLDINQSFEIDQKLVLTDIKNLTDKSNGEISSLLTNKNLNKKSYYIVEPGDSLSLISLKVYGNLYDWPKILKANNLINPDQIEIGMKLIIPE